LSKGEDDKESESRGTGAAIAQKQVRSLSRAAGIRLAGQPGSQAGEVGAGSSRLITVTSHVSSLN